MQLWWERMVTRSYFLWTVYCDLQGWWRYYGRTDNFPWWATKVVGDPVLEAACGLPEPLGFLSVTLGMYTCWFPTMIFDMVTWPLQYILHGAFARKDRRRETARKVAAALKGREPITIPAGMNPIVAVLNGIRRRPIA